MSHTIFPVLVDCIPDYLHSEPSGTSLLLAPVGLSTLMDHISTHLTSLTQERPYVVSMFEPGGEYTNIIKSSCSTPVKSVLSFSDMHALLQQFEPSDVLLLIDPRCWPVYVSELTDALDKCSEDLREVRHFLAAESTSHGTREMVHTDRSGQVNCIQRYYEGVTWQQSAGVVASLLPVWAIQSIIDDSTEVHNPRQLRAIVGQDAIASSTIQLTGGVYDLTSQEGFLQFSEQVTMSVLSGGDVGGRGTSGRHILTAPDAQIDTSVRFCGPVIVQSNAVIEPDAMLIGPVVVGRNSRICSGSVVVQSVVTSGTTVRPGEVVRHHVTGDGIAVRPVRDVVDGFPADADGSVRGSISSKTKDSTRSNTRNGHGGIYPHIKRVSDTIQALLGLLVVSPILAVVAILIKLDSKGPLLFGHEREGKNGKIFKCWKFRTMVHNAHALQRALYEQNQVDGPQFKMNNDPRITRVGRWLRDLNLDELPQLLNVIFGQMSLIGPRPSPFRENQICVPWRNARLSVRPGITGLWQICRHERSAGDFHQWIYYDMLYVRHMSWWLDLKIMVATVLTLAGRWNVPLSWMIPADKLDSCRDDTIVGMWTTGDIKKRQTDPSAAGVGV